MRQEIVFWNVDTQYDFMRNDASHKGTLHVKNAIDIEENLAYLTKLAKEYDIRVINTGDWHTLKSREISDNPDYKTTFPKHCMIGTKGAEFVPATNPENPYIVDWRNNFYNKKHLKNSRNVIIYKDYLDVFSGNRHTDDILKTIKLKKVIVYGVATEPCVDFAVKGLRERGVDVLVPTDAVKELPTSNQQEILNTWKNKGVKLITTKDVKNYLVGLL